MTASSAPLRLRAALDTYGHTAAIKRGELRSERFGFDFADVKPMNRAFAPMAMEQAFDFSEMAIVTFLQALAFDKPIVLLPIVMLNRFHHGSIVVRTDSPLRAPKELEGKRIGVRAYTQTTGTWTRGILHAEYGVDLTRLQNITQEGGHVREYVDPPNCTRVAADKPLAQMLLDGDIDAWIGGRDVPRTGEFRPVVADAPAAEAAWYARLGALPINHMCVLRRDVFERDPWLAREIFELVKRGKAGFLERLAMHGSTEPEDAFKVELVTSGRDPLPLGVPALRDALDLIVGYAYEQLLIPKRYAVEELFDPRMLDLA